MRASEVMIADPVVAAAGATSSEVAALMRVKNISVVPVVDNPKDRHYLGTISDRDIVARCVGAGHDPTDCSAAEDRKSTRLNSSHQIISYAVFCLQKKNPIHIPLS